MRKLAGWCLAACLTGPAAFAGDKEQTAADKADEEVRRLLLRLGPVPLPHAQAITSLTFSRDGKTVTTVSNDEAKVFVWDAASGKLLRQTTLPQGRLESSAVRGDGKALAVGGSGRGVAIWDPARGTRVRSMAGAVGTTLAFSPDGKSLLAGTVDGPLGIWDATTGKQRCRLANSDRDASQMVAFSSDGKLVAATRADGRIGVWEADSGKELRAVAAGTTAIRLLAFVPGSKQLAAADASGLVRLWDTTTARETQRFGLPADHDLRCGVFSADGRMLLTGGGDRSVRLWEVASGTERHRYPGHEDSLTCAAFAPDGRSLVVAGADNLALVREVGGRAAAEGFPSAPIVAENLRLLWTELASSHLGTAYRAISHMADTPGPTVVFLKEHLGPATLPEPKELARMLRELDSPRYATREKAVLDLANLGPAARPAILKLLDSDPPLEVRRRAERTLEKLKEVSPEKLRSLRAVEVLELIGTREARQLLQVLAKGTAEDRLTQQARSSLNRLEKRSGPAPSKEPPGLDGSMVACDGE